MVTQCHHSDLPPLPDLVIKIEVRSSCLFCDLPGRVTMTRVVFFSCLLVLSSLYGLHAQDRGLLRTLPNYGDTITCTGNLECEQSVMWCMPGDIEKAVTPVLVPTNLRAETVKTCPNDSCSLCVQVTVEISAAFPTEQREELGSGDCDYEYNDQYYDQYSDEEEEASEIKAVNVFLQLENLNNGSIVCGNLIIAPLSLSCYTMRMSLPLPAVPPTRSSNSTVVGSVVYNCLRVQPGAEMNIASYTYPRYSEVLSIYHEVPGCTQLDLLDKISSCDFPLLDFVSEANETSVGIVNTTNSREITLWVYYFYKSNATYSNNTMMGEMRHYIPPSDIVPCMCIQAWYSDLQDAYRNVLCPFKNYSDEGMLNKSKLEVKFPVYELSAACHVVAEAALCWKSESSPECRVIPNTRKRIVSQEPNEIRGLVVPHPSLCVQVSVKGRILHTECFKANVRRELQNGALLVKEEQKSKISVCLVEDGGCKTLYNTTHQSRIDVDFLEEKLVTDVMSDHCVQILSSAKQNVSLCNVDKYMRSRWMWSRLLCLLVVACVLLILLLKIESLKKWLKSVRVEKPLDKIFKNRRVLILYSPDNPAYMKLVRAFALSLQDLKLDVVLDQWHRTEMARVNPLPWYQKQKSEAFEKRGLIILLFSEGAKERYTAWEKQSANQVVDSDPYGSFGAVLNCVYADFQKGQTKGRYLVASFGSDGDVVPNLFRVHPAYILPSQLVRLLQELAGDNTKMLGKKQAKRLSGKITDKLHAPLNACLKILNRQTGVSQDGSESSESPGFSGKVTVELQPLMKNLGHNLK
ncbi:PREDICTED: interleukin-17 receptor C [Nanorana parkeri]|uniref:interleukin-17 receptor C n=1 Tax=Nanorana parkeri TaxID=125878 RepID=UPI000854F379|nr:PREDICTED: interleukin-17 receptor C [Nanorana parkeri]